MSYSAPQISAENLVSSEGTLIMGDDYLPESNAATCDFIMDEPQKIISGIQKAEQKSIEDKVQQAVLERLGPIQEEAYQKGFELGLEEGKNKAFEDTQAGIQSEIESLDELTSNMYRQLEKLYKINEARLIELAFEIGKRLAAYELSVNNAALVSVVRGVIDSAVVRDKVILELNPSMLNIFEQLQTHSGREYAFLKNVIIQENESLKPIDCIVKTEFGELNAEFDVRAENLFNEIRHVMPRVS